MPSPNVATMLRDHVSLTTSCIDRLYLNGYVPRLQSAGQLCAFLCDHLGNRIASPAAFRPLHDRFVQAVGAFADQHLVPVVSAVSAKTMSLHAIERTVGAEKRRVHPRGPGTPVLVQSHQARRVTASGPLLVLASGCRGQRSATAPG